MTRRIPIIPTLVVAAAVAAMIALGIWQIHRAQWKEALLQRYASARTLPPLAYPAGPIAGDPPLYRRVSGECLQPVRQQAIAGENRSGESGFSFLVDCRTGAEGPGLRVDIGWSRDPNAGKGWTGGPISGMLAPDRDYRMRIVSAVGLAGLQPSRLPDPSDLPNNHRGYAVQWFLFAAVALVIYGLALRGRWREREK